MTPTSRNTHPFSFLSKVLEKVVASCLREHIYKYHILIYLQSAYKRFQSTETALLKIHNDVLDNMDNSKVTALTLLDLSAAFDTIDQLILLQSLHRHFGISDTTPRWIKSYFSDRHIWHNINISLHSECRKDPSLALNCIAYIPRLSANHY